MRKAAVYITVCLYLSSLTGCATTTAPGHTENSGRQTFWQCVTHEDFGAAVAFVIITSPILVPGLIVEAIENKFKKNNESQEQQPTKEEHHVS